MRNYRRKMTWKYKQVETVVLRTDSLAQYFGRILDTADFICTVYGPKGIGKSISTIGLCMQICPEFSVKEDIVFTLEDFYETMEKGKQKYHRVKILDDFGSELDPYEGMFDPAKHTSHYFQMSRLFHTGYFITTPNKAFINKNSRERLADYSIEITAKNEDAGFCLAKVHQLKKNIRLNKTFYYSLYVDENGVINSKGLGRKVWEWVLPRPPQEVIEEYLPLREKKGLDQLKKSADEVRKYFRSGGNITALAKEVVKRIEGGEFIRVKSNGKRLVDYPLIELEYNLGSKRIRQLRSLIEQKIGDLGVEEKEGEEGDV